MPLLDTTGSNTADAYGGGAAAVPTYIEDVFSTYLINLLAGTGNQQIPHGLNLSTYGGLTWVKNRASAYGHTLGSPSTGTNQMLFTNTTDALTSASSFVSFDTNGTTITRAGGYFGNSNEAVVSWNLRKQPKFFDVVTFTTGASGTYTFNHNLGSVPGCVMIKSTGNVSDWNVYHQSIGVNSRLFLNQTSAKNDYTGLWGTPTSTTFTGDIGTTLEPNQTHVAYLFASNSGGFGLTGTDNVISCGSFTTDGSGAVPAQSLGYEPQFILYKQTNSTGNWIIGDIMRGIQPNSAGSANNVANVLYPNTSGAEFTSGATFFTLSPTGFYSNANFGASNTFIYIAIRRGPMKVPTDATKVYNSVAGATGGITTGFVTDFGFVGQASGTDKYYDSSRLTGGEFLNSTSTVAADNSFSSSITWDRMNGFWNNNLTSYQGWGFRRAPSFFDEVCYTGTGATATTQTHNLGATPEFMIIKSRNTGSTSWVCYHKGVNGGVNPQNYYMLLQSDQAQTALTSMFNDTAPTSSVFTVGPQGSVGASGRTYVAYLFATCAGISKVGSYTGTGTLTTINCGFAGGARFVLIKRTDSTSNWFVWDTARGMVSGTDPSLALNTTSAESNANSVYTITTGFQLLASPSADVNTSGATYIFLAIA